MAKTIATGECAMQLKVIDKTQNQSVDSNTIDLLLARTLNAVAQGDLAACFDLGVMYSTGSHGAESDLIEAHKWFNIAASRGHEDAAFCRADISDEMTAREIAEAQRRARHFLAQERKDVA